MTTAELLKLLKKNGCTFIRDGGRHDIYFPVGRHNKEEVPNGTLQNILKCSGLK